MRDDVLSGKEPPSLSDVLAVLVSHPSMAWAIDDGAASAQHDPCCMSLPYAVRADEPLLDGDFDCLRCRFTFHQSGAAHVVGTGFWGCYAFCACDWQIMLAHPDELARARRLCRIEGMVFSVEEMRLQSDAIRHEVSGRGLR
jgi:hypothetical protein